MKVRIPQESLGKVNVTLFDQAEREALDAIIREAEEIGREAMESWIRTLRWKSHRSGIGQYEVTGRETGWGTYLLEAKSEKPFYTSARIVAVLADHPLPRRTWRAVGESLSKREVPPPWFGFLFDGEHKIATGDLHGSVLSLAIAAETVIRTLMAKKVSERGNSAIQELLDSCSISRILDRWGKLAPEISGWAQAVDKAPMKKLFEWRNRVAHRGETESLTAAECRVLAGVTRTLVLTGDQLLRRLQRPVRRARRRADAEQTHR